MLDRAGGLLSNGEQCSQKQRSAVKALPDRTSRGLGIAKRKPGLAFVSASLLPPIDPFDLLVPHHSIYNAHHTSCTFPSTNNHNPVFRELVRRNFEIERRGALSRPTRHIVMRSMARAEPATEIARLAYWHASQVGAYAHHDQPFGLLHAVFILLRVSKGGDAGVDMLAVLEEG